MSLINVLDKQTVNMIAAGEVIERPASVIKELVENSIDAGATAITCEVRAGGTELIRITDNGSGIDREDIRTAFLRHATSKIRTAEDLASVLSLGFRGEALASIAAIAETELITKTRDSFTGIRYIIENGEEKLYEEIGCPEGTTFIVRDIFKNVPVRRKFLKSAATESAYCNEVMERLSISHPEISFKFINNGRVQIFTNGSNSIKNIVFSIYGREIASELTPVDWTSDNGIVISGYVAKPTVARNNRNLETYFVNGRFIKDIIISKAIEDAYHPFLMQHKYPFTVLALNIPAESMDVNVHPTKQEVRFENREMIYRSVFHAVSDSLSEKKLVPAAEAGNTETKTKAAKAPEPVREEKAPVIPEPFEVNRRNEFLEKTTPVMPEPAPVSSLKVTAADECCMLNHADDIADNEKATENEAPENRAAVNSIAEGIRASEEYVKPVQMIFDMSAKEKAPVIREETKEDFKKGLNDGYKLIGQVFNTYWIVEKGTDLFIIDQHAAHEKIIFERLMAYDRTRPIDIQLLAPALIISLSPEEAQIAEEYADELARMGFEVEPFGGREFRLNAVPLQLYGLDPKDVVLEIIDSYLSSGKAQEPVTVYERLATCSCKAAVKGNTKLSEPEARKLIEELLTLENPFNCPHGRPIMIDISKTEMEKKFKRIV